MFPGALESVLSRFQCRNVCRYFGVGMMLSQYPTPSAGQHLWVWWGYFGVQMLMAVAGTILQCSLKKEKGYSTVEHRSETHREVGLDFQVEVDVQA